jgi:hypothetical protein
VRSLSGGASAAPKVKNAAAAEAAKVEIRRNILAEIGEARVFDAYAGQGAMHAAVWSKAASYVGCDLELAQGPRSAFVADNRRVLRAVDLQAFNLFDLDAYGSPWEAALIIASNRRAGPGERIGMAITEGSSMSLRLSSIPTALRVIAGISGDPAGLAREYGAVIDAALAGIARRMGCGIERRWQAQGKTGAAMRYIGLVLVGA